MSKLRTEILAAALAPPQAAAGGGVEASFRFPHDFSGFAGHFPGFPILPAVVQVQTAFCLAETGLGRPLRLAGLENAKFLLQLRPEEEITVHLREKERGGRLDCDCRLSRGGELAASFTLVFEEGGPA